MEDFVNSYILEEAESETTLENVERVAKCFNDSIKTECFAGFSHRIEKTYFDYLKNN